MKNCPCGVQYSDDHVGACANCGAGPRWEGSNPSAQGSQLVWSGPMAAQQGAREERQINARDHNNMRFAEDDPVYQMAREMVLDFRTPEQRARDDRDGA